MPTQKEQSGTQGHSEQHLYVQAHKLKEKYKSAFTNS